MQLSQVTHSLHTIQRYSPESVEVNHTMYSQPILITPEQIIVDMTNWQTHLQTHPPEILLVGSLEKRYVQEILDFLVKNQLPHEHMTIGAACRTFNVLLSEQRKAAVILYLGKQ